jgi:ABC-2 type transport system ATP-binding protein
VRPRPEPGRARIPSSRSGGRSAKIADRAARRTKRLSEPPVIRARGLTRYYGATVGVEDLDLEVERGEIFGFLGPNGSGKTTTIRLLLDLLRPSRGAAWLFGASVRVPAVRARIGYLPGELALDGRMSGNAMLRFLAALIPGLPDPAHRRGELCDRLGLPPGDLRRRVREYSRGMKQKLGLVGAFQHDPELIMLDEPTEGLDPLVRETVFALMTEAKRRGATVFHSSHVLSEVDRTCDRVAILRRGRLAALMRVDDVRRASLRPMVVEFAAEPPLTELRIPGVELVQHDGRRCTLRVTGPPDALLRVLARFPVSYLAFPESNLEEAFAAFYRGDVDPRA